MAFSANKSTLAQTKDTMFDGWLNPEEASDYFAEVEKTSIIQQLARKVPIGPNGVVYPQWAGTATAAWVGEGDKKPITKGNFTKNSFRPHKIATIFVASAEVVRANPLNYLNVLRTKVAEAIALEFDNAAMHGTNTPFGAYLDQTTKYLQLDAAVSGNPGVNTYTNINVGLRDLVNDGYKMNGILIDDSAEPLLNASVDSAGRPLYIDSPTVDFNAPFRQGKLLGRSTIINDHVAASGGIGYAGDFTQLLWGQVGGLSFSVSDQATLDLSAAQDGSEMVSLWQNNLVAVLVEAEYAFLCNNPNAFVKLTNVPVKYTTALGGATGGTFTLSVGGKTTAAIAYNAAASAVESALEALTGVVGTEAAVSGSAGAYTITGVRGEVKINGASLTGGSSAATITPGLV